MPSPRLKWGLVIAVMSLSLALATGRFYASERRDHPTPPRPSYPYPGPVLNGWITESYRIESRPSNQRSIGPAQRFSNFIDAAFRRVPLRSRIPSDRDFPSYLRRRERQMVEIHDSTGRAGAAIDLARDLHEWLKTVLPNFSLNRGFEFINAERYGERQCFLQSVLLASWLQSAGLDAGVVMVNRSDRGLDSNNGHAVTLLRLPTGRDLLVDASEKEPFARHQGLFAAMNGGKTCLAVNPVYAANSPQIERYLLPDRSNVPVGRMEALSPQFIHSQFEYYRGERAAGGLLVPPFRASGLVESADHLRRSASIDPRNPLPVYLLARVRMKQERWEEARVLLVRARSLYRDSRWQPRNLQDAWKLCSLHATENTASRPSRPSGVASRRR